MRTRTCFVLWLCLLACGCAQKQKSTATPAPARPPAKPCRASIRSSRRRRPRPSRTEAPSPPHRVQVQLHIPGDERERLADLLEAVAQQELRVAAETLRPEDEEIRLRVLQGHRPLRHGAFLHLQLPVQGTVRRV